MDTFTATGSIVMIKDWFVYVKCTEFQCVIGIATMNNMYVNGSPAYKVGSSLKNILNLEDIIYIHGVRKMEGKLVTQAAISMAWTGKKPKNIPDGDMLKLLYSDVTPIELENATEDVNLQMTLYNGLGMVKELAPTNYAIELPWSHKLKWPLKFSEFKESDVSELKEGSEVKFHATQKPNGDWLLLKVWKDGQMFETKVMQNVPEQITDVPILKWCPAKEFESEQSSITELEEKVEQVAIDSDEK